MSSTILRWARAGAGTAVNQQPGGAERNPTLDVAVRVTGDQSDAWAASGTLHLLGPGDAVGLDVRQVTRMNPVPGSVGAEPEYFCHIEFARPDLPWMFSPYGPVSAADVGAPPRFRRQGTLVPWIALIVVARRPGVTLLPGDPRPVLHLEGLDEEPELPPLDEAHAWAHTQLAMTPAPGSELPAGVSRLLCPRRLRGRTTYLACVVPTFAAGVQAGMDLPVVAPATAPAWTPDATVVDLPVYHWWEFSTGEEGDFRTLAQGLMFRSSLPGVGTRPMNVSSPGGGLPGTPGASHPVGGALRPVSPPPPDPADSPELPALLDARDRMAPPSYGRWHAAEPSVANATRPWFRQLNRTPAHRVAAALGTAVVQRHQETLMAACWDQLGEVERANQQLRFAQAALEVASVLYQRRVIPLSPTQLLTLAGPAAGRLPVDDELTLAGRLRGTCLPRAVISGTWRRILRRRGALGRRIDRIADGAYDFGGLTASAAGGGWPARRPPAQDAAVILPEGVLPGVVGAPHVAAALLVFRTVSARDTAAPCNALPLPEVAGQVRAALDPIRGLPARVRARIGVPAGAWQPVDGIDQVLAHPTIPTPMSRELRDLGQDWLLPGVAAVPEETVAMLRPNAPFIESFLAGLNTEISRELLWRGYPTDQRGTVFARFWDRRASMDDRPDIPPVHQWRQNLGSHLEPSAGDGQVVLLLRGRLLRRYPNALIYLHRASATRPPVPMPLATAQDWELNTRQPSFRGGLQPDLTFLAFPVPVEELVTRATDPGWFVVIAEQPTELRFGLPAGVDGTPPPVGSWTNLTWRHVATSPAGHLDVERTSTESGYADLALTPRWDGRADSLAAQLRRPSFRLFTHADVLIQV